MEDAGCLILVLVVLVACVGEWTGTSQMVIWGGVTIGAGVLLNWYANRFILPASVKIGELRTFGDLALVVARACTHPALATGARSDPDEPSV